MLRKVDCINGCDIQKVSTPSGKLIGYQVVYGTGKVERVPFLSSARLLAHAVKVRDREIVAEIMERPIL